MMTFKEFIAANPVSNKKAPQTLKGSKDPDLVKKVRHLMAKRKASKR